MAYLGNSKASNFSMESCRLFITRVVPSMFSKARKFASIFMRAQYTCSPCSGLKSVITHNGSVQLSAHLVAHLVVNHRFASSNLRPDFPPLGVPELGWVGVEIQTNHEAHLSCEQIPQSLQVAEPRSSTKGRSPSRSLSVSNTRQ